MWLVGKSADLETDTLSGCGWLVRVQILTGIGIGVCLVGNSADLETDTVSGCGWLVIVQILKGVCHRDVVGW